MKKENTKYVEPNSYFTKEALKVFKEANKEDDKKKDEQKKRENEELRKVFKGK